MDAVHDEAHEGHVLLAQAAVEVQRLVECRPGGPRDEHEARVLAAKQRVHLLGPLLEARVHAFEGQEELRQVLQELQAQDPVGQVEREGSGAGGDLQGQPPRHEVRLQEPAQHAGVEEAHETLGSLEEVEGVAGGRRVQHHEVEAVVGRQLEQLLHRHVLVAAGQGGGDLPVEAVVEDAAAGRLARGVPLDESVEGPPGVEHHRPQRAVPPGPKRRQVEGTGPAAERGQAEARRQAPGGIDGADEHVAALQRGLERQGRRGGGLADAPRAAHHEHAALAEGRGQRSRAAAAARRCHAASIRRARRSMEEGPMSSSKRYGRLAMGKGSTRRSRP